MGGEMGSQYWILESSHFDTDALLHLNMVSSLEIVFKTWTGRQSSLIFISYSQLFEYCKYLSRAISWLESTTEHCPPLARRHAQHEEEGDDEEEDDGTAHVHRRADPGDGHCTETNLHTSRFELFSLTAYLASCPFRNITAEVFYAAVFS